MGATPTITATIEKLVARCDQSVRRRRRIEIRIVRRVIRDLLSAGYQLHIVENDWPGEEENMQIDNGVASLERLFAVDEEYLYVSPADFKTIPGRGTGSWVRFVFGNDGFDVISDYTTNLEKVLAPINCWVSINEEKGNW